MNRLLAALLLFLAFVPQADSLVILQYHHISNSTPKSTSLSPLLFEQHLDYLYRYHFKVLPLDVVIKGLKKGEHFDDKTVVITFDDGYRSIYTTAFPLLKKYRFPFTVFINTAPLEKELAQFMNWQELQEFTQNRGLIGNHSVNHPHLIKRRKPDPNKKLIRQITREITQAQTLIESKLNHSLMAFAYPYGEFDSLSKVVVKRLGFVGFGQHSGAVLEQPDLQALPRFPFGGDYGSMPDFIIKVNSLALPLTKSKLLNNNGNALATHLLSFDLDKPKLKLSLKSPSKALNVQCYSSNGLKLARQDLGASLIFTPLEPIPVGRSRYNCTAASEHKDRFYWFSQPLIRAKASGDFY